MSAHGGQKRIALFYLTHALAEQRGRHSDSECSRGLEIDHQLEFGRLHNRQVGGLAPLRIFSVYSPICRITITRKKPSPATAPPCVRCDKSALVQDAFGNLTE